MRDGSPDMINRVKNRRSAATFAMVGVAMFGFGYALVPLYSVFCQITGLGGKTGVVQAASLDGKVDTERLVTVEFSAVVNSNLPWSVTPSVERLQVHPGKIYAANYVASNLSSSGSTGRAVPNVVPSVASRYFNKTECFCFQEQHISGNQPKDMPLRFVISKDLPKDIRTVTLSYTFFNAGEPT